MLSRNGMEGNWLSTAPDLLHIAGNKPRARPVQLSNVLSSPLSILRDVTLLVFDEVDA